MQASGTESKSIQALKGRRNSGGFETWKEPQNRSDSNRNAHATPPLELSLLIFRPADSVAHRAVSFDLNLEYISWISGELETSSGVAVADVVGMPVPEYVASVIGKVCGEPPPNGCFYLVEWDGQAAGMGGLRRIREDTAELKRVYVRPAFRGNRIGEAVVRRVLGDAEGFGFQRVFLESGPFMRSAHRLYEAAGFVDRSPYLEAEVPVVLHDRWRFMERIR